VSVETSESLLRLEEASGQGPKHGETRAVFFGSAFAKETAKLCIGNVVVSVADFGAHGTHAHSINHSAGVAVIPVFHKFNVSNDERAPAKQNGTNEFSVNRNIIRSFKSTYN
jgi:hypothetical protein